ncbi:hypothetical protein [Francisella adeliensis]|nr:hypothetical protein [Francisella adeliensis]
MNLSPEGLNYAQEELAKLQFQAKASLETDQGINIEEQLYQLGYTQSHLRPCADRYNCSILLNTLLTNNNSFVTQEISLENRVNLVVAANGNNDGIQVFFKTYPKLKSVGYKINHCVNLLKLNHDGFMLKNLIPYDSKLTGLGYKPEDIIRLASHGGGSVNLEAVLRLNPQLIGLGYKSEDIIRLASHDGGSVNLEAVLRLHSQLTRLGYKSEDIIRLASHGGGSVNLEAVLRLHSQLTRLGYKSEDIIRLASHGGGSVNLEAVLRLNPQLIGLGYKSEDIIRLASHGGGSVNLEAVLRLHSQLTRLGYKSEDIIRLASHGGGSVNLEAVLRLNPQLIGLGYKSEDIIRLASHGGGSVNLEAVLRLHSQLTRLGYKSEDIIRLASHGGGSVNLEAVLRLNPQLIGLGYKSEDIIRLASHDGGSVNLEAVLRLNPQLIGLGYKSEDIIRLASHDGGSINLEAVLRLNPQLIGLGYKSEDIIRLASSNGGSVNLEAVLRLNPQLIGLGYKSEDIIRLASSNGGSVNLEAVLRLNPQLIGLGYKSEDIIRLASHDGGSVNLEAVLRLHSQLTRLGYKSEDIIRLASSNGGSVNLEAVIAVHKALHSNGYNKKQIVLIASGSSGGMRLHALNNYHFLFHSIENIQLLITILQSHLEAFRIEQYMISGVLLNLLKQGQVISEQPCKILIDSSILNPNICQTLSNIINKYQFKNKPLYFNPTTSIITCMLSTQECYQLLAVWERRNISPSEILNNLLNPINIFQYQLISQTNEPDVYFLDCYHWHKFYPNMEIKQLQQLLIKAINLGINNCDILPEDNRTLIIEPYNDNWIKLSISIIDTIMDDSFNNLTRELFFCQLAPDSSNLIDDAIYIYKTQQTIEFLVTSKSRSSERFILDTSTIYKDTIEEIEQALTHKLGALKGATYHTLIKCLLAQGYQVTGYFSMNIIGADVMPPTIIADDYPEYITLEWLSSEPMSQRSRLRTHDINSIKTLHNPTPKSQAIHQMLNLLALPDAISPLDSIQNNHTSANHEQQTQGRISPISQQLDITLMRSRKRPLQKSDNTIYHDKRYWTFIGEGSYNKAYTDGQGFVVKVAKNELGLMDKSERSVRVFNEINPTLPQEVLAHVSQDLWISPLIENETLSPIEQASFIFKTYIEHGRLILDGYCQNNLLQSAKYNTPVCIDPGNVVRRNSIASQEHWYAANEKTLLRRQLYRKHMIDTIDHYHKIRHIDRTLPILMILALDFIDRKMQHLQLQLILKKNIKSLGIAFYFYYKHNQSSTQQEFILSANIIDKILYGDQYICDTLDQSFKTLNKSRVVTLFRQINIDMSLI